MTAPCPRCSSELAPSRNAVGALTGREHCPVCRPVRRHPDDAGTSQVVVIQPRRTDRPRSFVRDLLAEKEAWAARVSEEVHAAAPAPSGHGVTSCPIKRMEGQRKRRAREKAEGLDRSVAAKKGHVTRGLVSPRRAAVLSTRAIDAATRKRAHMGQLRKIGKANRERALVILNALRQTVGLNALRQAVGLGEVV